MHSTSSDYKGGFDRLRCHLARIDAHLFTYFVCSFLIAAPSDDQPEYSIECRECRKSLSTGSEPKTPEPFVFALHTVALEGSNRFYSNLLDFVCLDCAIHICRSKVAFYDRKSADNAADKKRWQLSLRALLKLLSQKGTCCKVGLREMLRLLCILSNGNIGFEICHFQELLDLYVQERFASEQLGLWQETNLNTKSRRAPINRQHCFLDRQQVIDNLRCAYCQSDVSRLPNTQVGMVSTMYYNSDRVCAVPYFLCDRSACREAWSKKSLGAVRFSRLLEHHRFAVRQCIEQSFQFIYTVKLRLHGLTFGDFSKSENVRANMLKLMSKQSHTSIAMSQGVQDVVCDSAEDQKSHSANEALVMTVEADTLNKLFGLARMQTIASDVCQSLVSLQTDPFVQSMECCLRRCFCAACTPTNLLHIEMLLQYHSSQKTMDDGISTKVKMDSVLEYFSNACRGVREPLQGLVPQTTCATPQKTNEHAKPTVRRLPCEKAQQNASVSTSVLQQELDFREWQLSAKPFGRNHRPRCAYEFADIEKHTSQYLQRFARETSHFLSPFF